MKVLSRVGPAIKAAFNAATDRRYRYYYGHRHVALHSDRERLAEAKLRSLPAFTGPGNAIAEELGEHGIAMLQPQWSSHQLAEVVAYFAARPCADPYRPQLGQFIGPDAAPLQTHVGFFDNPTVVHAPHCLRLANDPDILAAVAAILGAKPTISYMAAWWSMPGRGEPEEAELFHRDVDDLRFVKLFVYLSDVTATSGPHMFVRGSHKSDVLSERIRYQDERVQAAFGREQILTLTGPAGTMFLENTFGLHRGVPPAQTPRLIFQVLYTLDEYIGGPQRPVRHVTNPFEGLTLDPYINRVYCRVTSQL